MPALFRPQMVFVVLSAVLLLAASALTGCAKSDRPACNVTADCDEGNVCEDGFCEAIEGSCIVHEDCENDYVCVAETCIPPTGDDEGDGDNGEGDNGEGDNGEGDNGEGDNGEGDNGEGDNGEGDEEEINPGSPIIESVTPADGATDLGLDVVVRITFDRPIAHEFGFLSDDGVFLHTPEGTKVDAELEYLEDEREVVLTPNQPLWKGTRYTINVTEFIRDESGNNSLQNPHQSVFTTAYELDDDLVALAELFAPTVYQETRLTDVPEIYSDIPTRVDFDGDFEGANNKASSMQASANPPAHVYYSVVSSETHHFIHYILYYPTRRLGSGATGTSYHEHSFTGIVMAVTRDDWTVELVEGVHTALSSANDSTHTFRPTSSEVEGRGTHENNVIDFDPDFLDGGAGFPLYVSSGDHASCFWHTRESSFWPSACHDEPEEFLGGEGLILTRGDVAQTIEDAVDGEEAGHREMTYELIPFVEPFWTLRGDFDCGLFSQTGFTYSPYSPEGHTPPDGPGDDPLYLSRALCTDDTDSYGNLPYRWFSANTGSNGGEWFLDPAVALSTRFDFGDDFSLDYCDNFYFNIDRNEDPACGGEE